jgi:hypothetical protein
MKLRPLMRSVSCSNYKQSQPRAHARGWKRGPNLALKPNRGVSHASASLETYLVFWTRTSSAFQRPNFPIWNTPATEEDYEYYCTAMNFLSRCHQTLPTKGCSWFDLRHFAQNLPARSCGDKPLAPKQHRTPSIWNGTCPDKSPEKRRCESSPSFLCFG